jgi:DNA-binding NtrC family response regulator
MHHASVSGMERSGSVLVVEDDAAMRDLVVALLEDEGLTAVAACDGVAALELLSDRSFSAILSDIKMPRMDGLALLREVHERWPAAKVIMMTAFGSPDDAGRAMRAGAFDLIAKPFQRLDLLDLVDRALTS